jgi:hypothetical protein
VAVCVLTNSRWLANACPAPGFPPKARSCRNRYLLAGGRDGPRGADQIPLLCAGPDDLKRYLVPAPEGVDDLAMSIGKGVAPGPAGSGNSLWSVLLATGRILLVDRIRRASVEWAGVRLVRGTNV